MLAGCALLVAACGGGKTAGPQAKQPTVPRATKQEATLGKQLYTSLGCIQCHSLNGYSGFAPTWKGLAGSKVKLRSGQTVSADEAYLLRAIENPDAQIVAGYQRGVMSGTIKPGQVSLSAARALIAYIKTLK